MSSGIDAWVRLKFSERFFQCTGAAFQDFFSDLMEAVLPGTFVRVRAAGPTGDLKCDGYCLDTGTLFQVYAPRNVEVTLGEMVAKMKADFAGALVHWKELMKTWVFVHNDVDGQRAERVKALAELAAAHPTLAFEHWSKTDLELLALSLDRVGRTKLFGPEPQPKDFANPPFETLAPLLKHLETRPPAAFDDGPVREVPPHKLEHNALSHFVAAFLQAGRWGDKVIEKFIAQRPDPTYGQTLALAFGDQYRSLRDAGYERDDIFHGLTRFVGGDYQQSAAHQAAIYCVLAYFFDRCDIFETPP